MKPLFILLILSVILSSCKKPSPVVEAPSPLVGKWLESRQIGQITRGGKTTNIAKNTTSQGAYYEFKADGSYTQSYFDSTASQQPNRLINGQYSADNEKIRLITDNTKGADIRYLEYTINDSHTQMYLTDSKELRLKAIDEQSKLDAQLAKSNSEKLQGIDEFDIAYRLQKQ